MKEQTNTIVNISVPVDVTALAQEVFQNLPECCDSLGCTGWVYGEEDASKMKFTFIDYEDDDKEYVMKIAEAEKGVAMVIEKVLAKKLFVGGLSTLEELLDAGNWDLEVVDAAVQCALFGEVIYG